MFQEFTTPALTKVIDDNLIEKSLSFARFFGGEIHGPNPRWFITGPQMPTNNGVVQATFAPDEIDRQITAICKTFRAHALPVTWWVGPNSRPANLGQPLQRHGFTHNRDMIGMAMDLHALHIPAASQDITRNLKLQHVADRHTLAQWYEIVTQCFPISYNPTYLNALADISLRPSADWWHYIGTLDGDVVTCSSLFLGAGVAGLYNLGVRPQIRHQGLGAVMTIKTYHAARDAGYRVGTLQTTYPNAMRMYHRMGFEVYCKIGIYRYNPQAHPHDDAA